jgi:hypothetical protein
MATRKESIDFERVITMEAMSQVEQLQEASSSNGMIRGPEVVYTEPWRRGDVLRETKEGATYDTTVTATEPKVDKVDLARQKVEEGIASLATALAAGNSEALTTYLATMSRFHHYSLGNTILIAFQNPEATHVAGFHTWKSMGRTVKKGEKGIMILAPIPKRFKSEAEETTSSGVEQRTETTEKILTGGVWGFRVVYVFDIAQTEGKELPQFAQVRGDPAEKLDRLKALVRKEGITLSYSDRLGGAYGLSLKGSIEILSGLTPAHEFSVLVHELAHELLHRDLERRAETDKTIRETEAEAVAYVVSQAIGLETSTQHADYIKLYRGSVETLTASLERIQQTATHILAGFG